MDDTHSAHPRVTSPVVGFLLVGALTGILWLVVAILGPAPAAAVPARPVVSRFSQPDGSTFRARLYGDEWSNGYETVRGYTVVKNHQSGLWEYAVRRNGKLLPAGVRADNPAPSGLRRHLRETPTERMAAAARGHAEFEESDTPNVGTQPSLVLLVDYNNMLGTTTEAEWATKFFGATGSVNHYYDQVSYNNLDLPAAAETFGTADNGVVGWLRIGAAHPNLEDNFNGGHQAITKAAIVASDPYVNYAAFDTNSNGSIQHNELHITVIVAGHETSYGGNLNSCGNSIWGHNWDLVGGEVPTVDGKQVASGAAGGGYNQFGERHCWSGDPTDDHMATIGIMVHEMGHDLNLPDLYDTNGGSDGIGEWSVMAAGSWAAVGANDPGSSPVHPDAFSKWYEGWLDPEQITGSRPGVALTQMATSGDVVQLLDNPGAPRPIDWTFQQNSGAGEYFLVENRQLSGYDAGLPGCGLLIWHIDETRTSSNLANADEARKLVDLEEADGLNELDNGGDFEAGDNGDPYRGPNLFYEASNPDSNLYGGTASGIGIYNVSRSCAATMYADMSTTTTTLPLNVSKTGTGAGSVTSIPRGIDCGGDCTHQYPAGTTPVTLTATPTGGSLFAGWSGDCSGTGSCVVDMVAAKSVTASFTGPTTTTVSVSKSRSRLKASGTVLPAHAGEYVRVTLYKRRSNGTWRKLTTKTHVLNSSSAYAATFNRPDGGRCKVTTVFAADGDHLGSKATKQFRC